MESLYNSRRKKLLDYMEKQSINIAFITSPINIYYLTGFLCNPHERFLALALDAASDKTWLFVPSLDLEAAQKDGTVQLVVPISDTEHPMDVLKREIGTASTSFGIEKNGLSFARYEQLAGVFTLNVCYDLEEFMMSLRMKKEESEIAKVRLAVEALEKVMEYATKQIVVGMRELDLAAELEFQMRLLGGDKPAFDTTILAGRHSAFPHGMPGTTTFQENDFILIDMGVRVQGYLSDITRTFILGEGTKEQEKIYETVLAANRYAIESIVVGSPLRALDDAARSVIASSGYGEYFTHRVGHGFGLEIHESPSIHGLNESLVEPGMLFTIEPGVYIPSIGGVRIEDDIYIKHDGTVEVLTNYKKLITRL